MGANANALNVRALDAIDAVPLPGLGAPRNPFISPNGQWIGYFDGTAALKKVAATGGPPLIVGRIDGAPRGAAWLPDDTIVFATQNLTTGLQRLSAVGGGEPIVLTKPDRSRGEADHLWPEALPGGHVVLFTIAATTGGLDAASIAAFDLRTGTQTTILHGGYHAQYAVGGYLFYGAAGSLRAVAFDPARLTMSGTPVPVIQKVGTSSAGAVKAVLAADGTLAYVEGGTASGSMPVWVDRAGKETSSAAPPRAYLQPRVSLDGTRAVFYAADQEQDLWLWEEARQTLTRMTFDRGIDFYPAWFPDGRRIAFSSDRAGSRSIFMQAADGTGSIDRLTTSSGPAQIVGDVSPDGKWIVFTETGAKGGGDIMGLQLDDRKIVPVVQTPFDERNPRLSRDGRWLVYEANDSGQVEIYVRPFPNVNGGHWQVSTGGGTNPVWARDSRALFYVSPARELMRVGVDAGATWSATAPSTLLDAKYQFNSVGGTTITPYDVSPDGKRFLVFKSAGNSDGSSASTSIVVVQHFDQELKRLVGR